MPRGGGLGKNLQHRVGESGEEGVSSWSLSASNDDLSSLGNFRPACLHVVSHRAAHDHHHHLVTVVSGHPGVHRNHTKSDGDPWMSSTHLQPAHKEPSRATLWLQNGACEVTTREENEGVVIRTDDPTPNVYTETMGVEPRSGRRRGREKPSQVPTETGGQPQKRGSTTQKEGESLSIWILRRSSSQGL